MKNPYCEKNAFTSDESGTNVNRMWEPSSGGIGKRLKTASRRFINTTAPKAKNKDWLAWMAGIKRIINPKTTASKMFEAGPARATFKSAYFPLKLKGFIGTGFAPPIIKLVGRIIIKSGKITVKKGSIWGIGFKVSRPIFFAVGSPREYAAIPWAYSWKTAEKISIIKISIQIIIIKV